ncbi:hypothetical protein LguiB_004133 [Lonicera macranthoides]
MDVGGYGFPGSYEIPGTQNHYSSSYFCPWDESVITDMPQGRRLLSASENHKEAEKRRRERINSHLDRLRTLLPCNPKIDKASLLAKVIERVKELKQQTSHIDQLENLPSETDEITVLSNDNLSNDGKILIEASLCCEDRSDLIPELIKTLRSLRLSPLRAEMVTFGGRIRNVMIVAGDNDCSNEMVTFLEEALRSLVQRSNPAGRSKRQRIQS